MSHGFKVGDRVRVTFEGEVSVAQSAVDGAVVVKTNIGPMPNVWVRPEFVEKIEPPVETFGPGDVVRDKNGEGIVFTIGRGGYISHSDGFSWWDDEPGDTPWTSEHFERVILVEPPL